MCWESDLLSWRQPDYYVGLASNVLLWEPGIYAKPKSEQLAKENLQRQGYETYLLPILGKIKKNGKTVRLIQPMFPR